MANANGNGSPRIGPPLMFPIPIKLGGQVAPVSLNADGTVSGDASGFLEAIKTVQRTSDPQFAILTWLLANAIRREMIDKAEMSNRLGEVARVAEAAE